MLGLKLADMLADTIKKLITNAEHCPLHAFFIDRGYLELAKEQKVCVKILLSFMINYYFHQLA